MIQKKLTINLPESAEALRNILRMLLQYNLISQKEARVIEQTKPEERKPKKKSRWAKAAEEMSKENLLGNGLGDEFRNYIHEFREGFAFKEKFHTKKG